MKLNLGRRIVLFVHWLASLALLAMIVFPEYVAWGISFLNWVPGNYMEIATIVLLTIYLLLSLSVLCMVFSRDGKRAERGFITVDSSDSGRVRIAISAIEQMVRQAACSVDGIADMKIGIRNSDDAVDINVNVVMMNGSHVPTVTLNMQRAIRQYVEMNCGVAVRSVSINIQSVTANADGIGKHSKRSDIKTAAPIHAVQNAAESVDVPMTIEPKLKTEPTASVGEAEPACVSGFENTEADVTLHEDAVDAFVSEDASEKMITEQEKEN